jgi:nicotinate-nucleotide adenylyltransferase
MEPDVVDGGSPMAPPAAVVTGRVGVLGGTFDPVHLGHLAVAEDAREALGLERVLLMPAGQPPHKPSRRIASAADRLAMLELAVGGHPGFEVSSIELDRPGPSFTVDTLGALDAAARAAGREPDLWFVLSSEAFLALPTWREPERILELSRLAVAPREGHALPPTDWVEGRFPGRGDRIRILDGPYLCVSATEIRARVAAGRSISYLVPDAVAAYIGDHDLYRDASWRKTRP